MLKIAYFLSGSEESFIYAKSARNQCIESFWSRLKKYKLNLWIDFFRYMINTNLHKPSSATHREVLRFKSSQMNL